MDLKTLTPPTASTTHEHGWMTASRHVTSDGVVRYVRCADCGAWRVDLVAGETGEPGEAAKPGEASVPRPVSRVVEP